MSNGTWDDGFYIRNLCLEKVGDRQQTATLRIEAYDANKQRIEQDSPAIPYARTRYVSTQHIGSAPFVYLLFFFDSEQFNPPPGIGIIQGTSGGGGSIGISVNGTGVSLGASATVTEGYSQPTAVLKMELIEHVSPGHTTRARMAVAKTDPADNSKFLIEDLQLQITSQGNVLGS